MAELGVVVDVDKQKEEYREGGAFTLLTPGWYKGVIIASEVKSTKDNSGTGVSFKFKTVCNNEVNFWINIQSRSDQAQAIGQAQLAKIADACGGAGKQISNTDVLHGIPFQIKIKRGDYKGKPSNEVVGFESANVTKPAPVADGNASAPQTSSPSDGGKPGW